MRYSHGVRASPTAATLVARVRADAGCVRRPARACSRALRCAAARSRGAPSVRRPAATACATCCAVQPSSAIAADHHGGRAQRQQACVCRCSTTRLGSGTWLSSTPSTPIRRRLARSTVVVVKGCISLPDLPGDPARRITGAGDARRVKLQMGHGSIPFRFGVRCPTARRSPRAAARRTRGGAEGGGVEMAAQRRKRVECDAGDADRAHGHQRAPWPARPVRSALSMNRRVPSATTTVRPG
jgi:hypothetical protein